MSTLIDVDTLDGIATITLNRPDKRNAMSDAMRAELIAVLESLGPDQSVRAVVLTGAGKGFCAGGDVAGMERRLQAPPGEVAYNGWARQQRVHRCLTLLHTLPKPTIAAVNGPASGLGADTAIACDFVIASPAASFAWSYIKRGLIPDGGGLYFLPRRIGLPLAKALVFTGRTVDAPEARQIGIVDRLTEGDTLISDARAWAGELSQGSLAALALGKSILNQTFEQTSDAVFSRGSQAQGICYTTAAHHDAVAAFHTKSAEKSKR